MSVDGAISAVGTPAVGTSQGSRDVICWMRWKIGALEGMDHSSLEKFRL